jgi:hypothetical protein
MHNDTASTHVVPQYDVVPPNPCACACTKTTIVVAAAITTALYFIVAI